MPRHKRNLSDNTVYHIVQRGHNKAPLFRYDDDYITFKDFISKYSQRFGFDLYHYCLMPNHFHLLMRIAVGNDLPKLIHGITQSYSHHYRRRYDHAGHVYQNRYRSFHIADDSYLLECGRYIERNPLRACIATAPSQYQWSSYNCYANNHPDGIITENPLYNRFGSTSSDRMTGYRKYVLDPRPYEDLVDRVMLA